MLIVLLKVLFLDEITSFLSGAIFRQYIMILGSFLGPVFEYYKHSELFFPPII